MLKIKYLRKLKLYTTPACDIEHIDNEPVKKLPLNVETREQRRKHKIYTRQGAEELHKPLQCYLPFKYKKLYANSDPAACVLSFSDVQRIFEACKANLVDEVLAYYDEMLAENRRQYNEKIEYMQKQLQNDLDEYREGRIQSYIM